MAGEAEEGHAVAWRAGSRAASYRGQRAAQLRRPPTELAVGKPFGGQAEMEELLSDYREVSGILVPHRIEVHMNGSKFIESMVKEAKVNSGVNPDDLARKPQ